ncbi:MULTISPECIES: monovalent cation:proton antiporter-2 (CPA2) family protein [unclassified Acidisoma]|jgi:monovalent cation:proton antiporter-2 (CPA2) family protein|uniref:monovalent cation:proton antiporter-2 (CPA2) family protein n=1 Tax=unclassified Acidisoma TaxID=2634065 RepID=UPI00131E27BB|nr:MULTISPECIES: monovalent cation:proton antiporter-2 (CPA2) family protein [unclassified Acidisoma]
MSTDTVLMQALVYLLASVIAVPIAKRAGLGSVLGYLIAGAAIGPFALHLVGNQADVMRFAEFGVVILLFLIGLEVRPALLWSMRAAIFGLGAAQLIGIGLCIAAAAMALGLDWRHAAAIGAILAMSSTAIVLQTLDEKGLRRGAVGSAAFGVLLFQDLSVIPLLVLLPMLAVVPVVAVAGADGGLHGWWHALAVLAAVLAIVAGGRYLIGPIFRFIAATRLREIYTATALLLVIGVTALMQLVGMSPALGAFLAGVMLAENEFRRELEADIEPFRGLLLGLFFITVGASLDFGLLMRHPVLILALTLGLMAIKAVAMSGIARAFRMPWGDARTVGVALCQGGEFAFVLVGFVVGAGVLTSELGRMLNAVVAVSMVLTPLVFLLHERFGQGNAEVSTAAVPDAFDETADVIIAGFGRFGQIAGRLIAANGFRTSLLDVSVSQIELLRRFGRRIHYGDATRLDLLRAAGAEKARLLVIAIDDREKALELVETAKQYFPQLTILARAWDRRHAYELLDRGADVVERETFEGGLALGRIGLQRLGLRANQALRAANLFRRQDRRLFDELMPLRDDEDGFILASRQSQATLDQLLSAELQESVTSDRDRGWDTSSVAEEMRDAAE